MDRKEDWLFREAWGLTIVRINVTVDFSANWLSNYENNVRFNDTKISPLHFDNLITNLDIIWNIQVTHEESPNQNNSNDWEENETHAGLWIELQYRLKVSYFTL